MRIAGLTVHIIAGTLGIVSGFLALYAVKGGTLHRKSGGVFVYAMVVMALVGATLAALGNVAPAANVPVGLLTAYLVVTGVETVRSTPSLGRRFEVWMMVLAMSAGLALATFGVVAASRPTGKLDGMPPYPFLIFGAIAALAVIGDLRMLKQGGRLVLRGAPRVARHLWRMSTALLIAAFSFFLGQAKVIPKPIRIVPLLMIPPMIVLVVMLYWLWRVRARRALKEIVIFQTREAIHGAISSSHHIP
jgi:uncharacterized membrane protein